MTYNQILGQIEKKMAEMGLLVEDKETY